MGRPPKYDWRGTILPAAAAFVESFTTGVTLRQCFYNLASRGFIANTQQDYGNLSRWTTDARDAGTFPDFIDNARWIHRPTSFASPDEAHRWLERLYRRDRMEFADKTIYLGVEKVGLVAQLEEAFGDLGLPILPLGGWASQTFREQVRRKILVDGRPAVLIYAGDGPRLPIDPLRRPAGEVLPALDSNRAFARELGLTPSARTGLTVGIGEAADDSLAAWLRSGT